MGSESGAADPFGTTVRMNDNIAAFVDRSGEVELVMQEFEYRIHYDGGTAVKAFEAWNPVSGTWRPKHVPPQAYRDTEVVLKNGTCRPFGEWLKERGYDPAGDYGPPPPLPEDAGRKRFATESLFLTLCAKNVCNDVGGSVADARRFLDWMKRETEYSFRLDCEGYFEAYRPGDDGGRSSVAWLYRKWLGSADRLLA